MEVIGGPDAPPRTRIRTAAAIFAVSTSCMFFMDPHSTDPDRELLPERPGREELRTIALELATDLAGGA